MALVTCLAILALFFELLCPKVNFTVSFIEGCLLWLLEQLTHVAHLEFLLNDAE